jgi:TatD DNase family protein
LSFVTCHYIKSESLNHYIDIHTHTYYQNDDTTMLLNVLPGEDDKLRHPCFFSTGLHPWYVNSGSLEQKLGWVEQQADNPQVLAVGEIGFDKTIDVPWKDQEYAFERQLSLAEKLNKPVILHCVRSYNELLSYRSGAHQKIPWIFHWFNASAEMARELIRRNCYLSFGHLLFHETSKAFRVFPEVPASSIFFETDDTSYTIQEISEHAAFLKGLPLSSLMRQIHDNFKTCFGIL